MIQGNENEKKVFDFFYEISKIPHGSSNTKAISDYCVEVAKKEGLWYYQDEYNNVIIKKPAYPGYENHEPVIIQGHLDMVCEKEDGFDFDFEKDSLRLKEEGDFLFAKGTTLGADDGIAVCYALSLLTSHNIPAPSLEVIFTTDEETGMEGAINIDLSCIKGKRLLNIDSECEGIFTVSCAGGINTEIKVPCDFSKQTLNTIEISLSGLTGGHSGVEIIKKRANANVVLGELLYRLSKIPTVSFVKACGGEKANAITPSSCVEISYEENRDKILNTITEYEKEIKGKYIKTDPQLQFKITEYEKKEVNCADKESIQNITSLFHNLPDGIFSMSSDIEGLVKTSSNMGIVKTFDDYVYILISIRSSDEGEKELIKNKVLKICEQFGAKADINSDYPAWEYKKNSPLRDIMCDIYKEEYNKPAVTEAIHAGLECGIFCGKIKDLECISFGPDIFDIHTPKEKLSISSAKRVWNYLLKVLKNL